MRIEKYHKINEGDLRRFLRQNLNRHSAEYLQLSLDLFSGRNSGMV